MKMEHKKKVIISCIIIAVILLLIGTVAVALHYKENNATGDASTETTNQDSTAPAVELKDSVIKIADFSEVIIEELAAVSDDSGYEVRVVGYEKVANLEEATEEYLAGLSGKTSGASVEGLDDSEPTEEGVYRIVFAFADMYENETLAEIYVVYDIPEDEEAGGDVKDEPSTEVGDTSNKEDDKKPTGGNQGTEQKPNTETQKPSGGGNSGSEQKPNTETQKPSGGGNSGSNTGNTNQGSTNTGNSGSTNTNQGSTNTGNSGSTNNNTGSSTNHDPNADANIADETVSDAGYYKVVPITGGTWGEGVYGVMIKESDGFDRGWQLLEEFLADMGYEPTGGGGSPIPGSNGDYIVYCTGIKEKGPENDLGF